MRFVLGALSISLACFIAAIVTPFETWGLAVSSITLGFWLGVLLMQSDCEAASNQAEAAIAIAERLVRERDEALEGKP